MLQNRPKKVFGVHAKLVKAVAIDTPTDHTPRVETIFKTTNVIKHSHCIPATSNNPATDITMAPMIFFPLQLPPTPDHLRNYPLIFAIQTTPK
jgi:hypothetical protein